MKLFRNLMLVAAIFACTTVQAQKVEDFGVFKHVGAGVSVGTEGIGINVATPVTNYLELSLGVNFMPGFSISGDVDADEVEASYNGTTIPLDLEEVNIKGKFSRTTIDFKASAYPFGKKNALFVTAGFSFGGKKLAKLKGHNDVISDFMNGRGQYANLPADAKKEVFASIDKYEVDFDDNGDVNGDIRVNGFRPYLGLGYGRLVPKHRVGFRVELGCQFMGKMKIYQNDKEVSKSEIEKGDDDLSKFVDKFTVYPVLKFTLTGRIL